MKILVTGATGFLGQHIIEEFKAVNMSSWLVNEALNLDDKYKYYDVVSVGSKQCNLTNANDTERLFKEHKPDIVLHAAALCGGILANKNSPADFIHVNTMMGLNIFKTALKFGTEYVYTLGSVCAYPELCPTPFKEENIWSGYPEKTNAPYGMAKRMLLMLQNSYREQYGIKGAHLIPINLYGKNDHFDLVNSHVVPALINKFVNAIQKNLPTVECWGTGEATRELFYVEDAARVIVKAIEQKLDTELPINLGTGVNIPIKGLAELIAKLTGFTGEIVFTGEVSDGQLKRRLDVSRAKAMLGWEAEVNLEDGLKRTIEWYRENKKD